MSASTTFLTRRALLRASTLCAALLTAPLAAHDPGLSSSNIRVERAEIQIELHFDDADLASALEIDLDNDGRVSQHEVQTSRQLLAAFFASGVQLRIDGQQVSLRGMRMLRDDMGDIRFCTSLRASPQQSLGLSLPCLAELPRGHRHLSQIVTQGGATHERLLSAARATTVLELGISRRATSDLANFIMLGLEHILTGWDHLAFVLLLIIAGGSLRAALASTTAFTLAHSITLGLAALGIVHLPSSLIEAAIALSIIWLAVEPLWRRSERPRVAAAFGFGLVHGFGFASVLTDFSFVDAIAIPLLGFNLGVELGQLLAGTAFFAVLALCARRPGYRRHCVPALSSLVGLVATYWLLERTIL